MVTRLRGKTLPRTTRPLPAGAFRWLALLALAFSLGGTPALAGTVEFLVTLPDGRPAPDIRVSLEQRRGGARYGRGARTDPEGRARIEYLSPATYHLRFGPWPYRDLVRPEDNPYAPLEPLTLARPEEELTVEVRLMAGVPVAVSVDASDDEPKYFSAAFRNLETGLVLDQSFDRAGVRISATLLEPGPALLELQSRGRETPQGSTVGLDPHDRFETVLPAGRWRIRPVSEWPMTSEPEQIDIDLAAGEVAEVQFTVRVEKGDLLRVRVVDEDRQPVPGAVVEVRPLAPEGADGSAEAALLRTAETGPDEDAPVLRIEELTLSGEDRDLMEVGPLPEGLFALAVRPLGFRRWTWIYETHDPERAYPLLVDRDEVAAGEAFDLGSVALECGPAAAPGLGPGGLPLDAPG
jgi:hypothetical protein